MISFVFCWSLKWALEGFSVRNSGGTIGDYDFVRGGFGVDGSRHGSPGFHDDGVVTTAALPMNVGGAGCGGWMSCVIDSTSPNSSMMIWNPAKVPSTPSSSSSTTGSTLSYLSLDDSTIETAGIYAPTFSSSAFTDIHRQRRYQSRKLGSQRWDDGPDLSPTSLEHAKLVLTATDFPLSSPASGPNHIRCDES
jgi:hypothetical protein